MPPKGHSPIGASKAKQWIACPGSRRMQQGIENKSSAFAKEGTHAHYLAEVCLRSGEDAAFYVGSDIGLPDEAGGKRLFKPTLEMAQAVQVYLDIIYADRDANPGGELEVERDFHLEQLHPLLWGSCDAVYGQPFGDCYVYDYKHGAGVAVDVEENPQLMFYALGAVQGEDYDWVHLNIVQPRASHPDGPIRRWSIKQADLEAWGRDVLGPAAHETDQPDALLRSGEHCRFCRAQHKCPELRAAACEIAALDTELLDADFLPAVPVQQITPPSPADLTPEQLAKTLDMAELIAPWVAAVKLYAFEQALDGHPAPGWKLVEGRRGNRAWALDDKVLAGKLTRYRQEIYDLKLKSPAQLEKIIKEHGDDPTVVLKDLVVRADGKPTLVRDLDPRPALVSGNAADAFSDYTDL